MIGQIITNYLNKKLDDLLTVEWLPAANDEIICQLDTEYVLYESESETPFQVAGMLNLSELKPGDTLDFSVYAKIRAEEPFIKHIGFTVEGSIVEPAVSIQPMLIPVAVKLVLVQKTGRSKKLSYVILTKDESRREQS